MHPTPKQFCPTRANRFLIKQLAAIANLIGQTLPVFYPKFLQERLPISFLIQQVTNLAPTCASLGYFILSMASFSASVAL